LAGHQQQPEAQKYFVMVLPNCRLYEAAHGQRTKPFLPGLRQDNVSSWMAT
jgi:hypothetical protein